MTVILNNDETFSDSLLKNEKIVVKFYADWCGSCRLFAPKFKRLSEDERFAGITFLEVNAEKSPQTRKLAGVSNLPFFAIFKNGVLIQEGLSTSKEENVVSLIEKLN